MPDDREEGLLDKAKGRAKKAVGDVTGDSSMRQEGSEEENRGEAKEELDEAKEKVEEKSREVENRS